METKTVETSTKPELLIPVELYDDLSELGKKYGLTPKQITNRLLQREMDKSEHGSQSFTKQLKDRKVEWAIPKGCFVVAHPISDIHFKRLRRWLDKKASLELLTDSGHDLVIMNNEMVSNHNTKMSKRVNVELDAALVEEAKKLNVNIEEAATRHFKNVKCAYP
jgi:hypothetical protein